MDVVGERGALGQRPREAPALALRHADFCYGSTVALRDITFDLACGRALALVGPNGSGKSTLLKGVLGLLPVRSGSIRVLGASAAAARPYVGYMPQSDVIDPDFPVTLGQVVMMGRYRRMGWLRWPSSADREAVSSALRRVGLSDLASRRFGALSGGQRQRGMLARALAAEPRMILLDEPFNGLDETNRDALLATLRDALASGVTVVVSTHDLRLAQEVCDDVLILNGRQIAFGPLAATLTVPNLAEAYGDVQVELDAHTVALPEHAHGDMGRSGAGER